MHRVLGGILIRLKLSLLSGYWVRVPYDSILIEHQDSQSNSFIWMFGPAYSKSTSDQSRTETIQTTNVTPPQPPKEPPPRKKIDTRQIQLPTILYQTVAYHFMNINAHDKLAEIEDICNFVSQSYGRVLISKQTKWFVVIWLVVVLVAIRLPHISRFSFPILQIEIS